jgi:cyclic pyranopterin phosphate synthase
MSRLAVAGALTAVDNYRPGHGPAKYYEFQSDRLASPAKLGFIGAITSPHFCVTCNKLRLTADGKLRPCLGRFGEIDLLGSLRAGEDPTRAFEEAIANKPENHEFLDRYVPGRPMTAIGG